MEYRFIKADHGFCDEMLGFTSQVDYAEEFSSLDPTVVTDLKSEVEFYYNLFKDSKLLTACIDITNKKISDISFDIDLYLYESSSTFTRIGFQVLMRDKHCILQHLSYLAPFNIKNFSTQPHQINIFKEYLYNCLFYVYTVCHKFRFHPMLKFFHHKNDISKLAEIKNRRHRLFGDEDNECSVCFETTITTTPCNHSLCHSCYSKLTTKVCPLCRAVLESNLYLSNLFIQEPLADAVENEGVDHVEQSIYHDMEEEEE